MSRLQDFNNHITPCNIHCKGCADGMSSEQWMIEGAGDQRLSAESSFCSSAAACLTVTGVELPAVSRAVTAPRSRSRASERAASFA